MTARQDEETAVAWPDGTARVYSHGAHRVVELSGMVDMDAEERVASAFERRARWRRLTAFSLTVPPGRR